MGVEYVVLREIRAAFALLFMTNAYYGGGKKWLMVYPDRHAVFLVELLDVTVE